MNEIAFFLTGVAVGSALILLLAMWRSLRDEKDNAKQRAAMFVAGLDMGVKGHAAWIRKTHHVDCQGFALTCNQCDNIFGWVQSSSLEYAVCPKCQHRNPAPLAPETEVSRAY